MHNTNRLSKPLKGGCFGTGKYELQTEPIICDGMHAVRYIVSQVDTGGVIAIGTSKSQAMGSARRLLVATQEAGRSPGQQLCLWSEADLVLVINEDDHDTPARAVASR